MKIAALKLASNDLTVANRYLNTTHFYLVMMTNQLHPSAFKKPLVPLLVNKPTKLIKDPDELLLFVESPGLIVELVKTFYGYKVCGSGTQPFSKYFYHNPNAAVDAADYFLEYVND